MRIENPPRVDHCGLGQTIVEAVVSKWMRLLYDGVDCVKNIFYKCLHSAGCCLVAIMSGKLLGMKEAFALLVQITRKFYYRSNFGAVLECAPFSFAVYR
jgi:hypothetical protein